MVSISLYPSSPNLIDKFPTTLGNTSQGVIFWDNITAIFHQIIRVDALGTVLRGKPMAHIFLNL